MFDELLSFLFLFILPVGVKGETCINCSRLPIKGTLNEYDCSYCDLHEIPKFPSSATKIDLSFNNISTIRRTAFLAMSALTEINFKNNMLTVIEQRSFSSLESLRTLVLYNNRLNCTSLESLHILTNLHYLDIRGNLYKSYPESITSLLKLTVLKIDVFRNFHFNKGFLTLKNLTQLDLDPRGKVTLRNNSFEGIYNSPIDELLIVFVDKIDGQIGIDFLRPFRFLKYLTLDISGRFDIKDVMKVLHGLRNRTLDYIDLSKNHWSIYRYHRFTTKEIDNLITICVKVIKLSDNSIYYFPFLESLNTHFSNCLEKFVFSNNDMFWTSSEIYGLFYYPSLKYLDISKPLPYTRRVFLGSSIPNEYNFHFNATIHAWGNLEYLDVSGIDFSGGVFNPGTLKLYTLFLDLPSLKILKAADTSWGLCNYDVYFRRSLLSLDMSGWNCLNLNPKFIQRHRHLMFLKASNSRLGRNLNTGKSQSMLHRLMKLERIDLSDNRINYLSKSFFKHQKYSLKYISIRNNNLRNVPETFMSLQSVSSVDLSYNNFVYLSKQDMNIIDMLENTTFNFKGNKFDCSCKYIDSLVWMSGAKNIKRNSICRDGSNMTLLLNDIHFFHLKCVSEFWLDFAVIVLLLIMLIILGAAIGYRNKSFVIYLCIKARRLVKQKNHETRSKHFKFDVFVSYSHLDYDWVTELLFKYLANELGLQVCIHQKDFIPGEPIAEEILRCVESSRRSAFVITRHFLASKWSLFEMDIARHHVLQSDSDTLIVIMKDDIPVYEMPILLRKIWWRIVCLKYPQKEDKFELEHFKKKLSEVFVE